MRTLPIYRIITDGQANVLITGAQNAEEALKRGVKAVTRSSETGERDCDFTKFQVVIIAEGSEIDASSPCRVLKFPVKSSVMQRKLA